MLSSTGLHILHDSGIPYAVDYTTLVFIHGYGCHSGIFARMIPYARRRGERLILVNRRDYPGTKPYSEDARRLLSPGTADPDTLRSSMSRFVKDRALEFSEFLAELVEQEGIPPARPWAGAGGIVLVGWSMGGLWMTAFLAHVASSPHSQILRQYVRRVVVYDTPSTTFGYPRPLNIQDPFMLAMHGDRRFFTPEWFSGFFVHGRTLDTLAYGAPPARQASPTLPPFSYAEWEHLNMRAPATQGGSDHILAFDGYRCGLLREVWERALYLDLDLRPPSSGPAAGAGAGEAEANVRRADAERGAWDDVEVRHVWCEMAFWETPHAALMIQAELADARAHGRRVRDVASVRLRGVNHFAHWTHPERTLQAFLADKQHHERQAVEASVAARL